MGIWDKLRALFGQGASDKSQGEPGRGAGDDATDGSSGAEGSVEQGGGEAFRPPGASDAPSEGYGP